MTTKTEIELLIEKLQNAADAYYVAYANQCKKTECLGVNYKLEHGLFGRDELLAHCNSSLLLGKHDALHEIVLLLKSGIEKPQYDAVI